MRSSQFTLVDFVATSSVAAVVIALLMPSALHARSSSRQQTCADHFKTVGLALHNYHLTYNVFPPGRIWEPNPMRPPHDHGVLNQLLPWLEHAAVYNTFNFHTAGWASIQNKTTRIQRIELFLCPDDKMETFSANIDPTGHPTNIAFSLGSKAWITHPTHVMANLGPTPEGIFFDNSSVGLRDIIDGTAFTIAAAEQRIDQARRDGSAEITGDCSGAQTEGKHYYDLSGSRWISGHPAGNYFNARRGPNDSQPDCFHGSYPAGFGSFNKVARSSHADGVTILLADGSARFVRNQVDLAVWQALNTRAGQERIDQNGF